MFDFTDTFLIFLLYKQSSVGEEFTNVNWRIVPHKDDVGWKTKIAYNLQENQYIMFELLDWLNICEHCTPTYHTSTLPRPWQHSCVCLCVRPRVCERVSGWHHTVACWEGLLHPHGIYNIYSPPEQMSSLSHSVWLASLHTGAPTKPGKWQRSYSGNLCHTRSLGYSVFLHSSLTLEVLSHSVTTWSQYPIVFCKRQTQS